MSLLSIQHNCQFQSKKQCDPVACLDNVEDNISSYEVLQLHQMPKTTLKIPSLAAARNYAHEEMSMAKKNLLH